MHLVDSLRHRRAHLVPDAHRLVAPLSWLGGGLLMGEDLTKIAHFLVRGTRKQELLLPLFLRIHFAPSLHHFFIIRRGPILLKNGSTDRRLGRNFNR